MNASRNRQGGAVIAAAVALIALFWWPLFRGGGFIGGDVYSYYLPQKVVYAEHLAHHELPLWNDRAGHGYPIVGESQTGPFYPFHALFYSLLSVNTAYNVNHLLHYVLAFVFTWLYARSVGLSGCASGLAAVVYTYGWFPARCCLEWAILGGAWLPAALWCVERFLQTQRFRYLLGLCGAITLQLLGGHFNLAFLTVVLLVPYVPLRLYRATGDLPEPVSRHQVRFCVLAGAAIACAFALAAVQIAPTWELKRLSQREAPGPHHELKQGAIPVEYWSQMVFPWSWYSLATDRDKALRAWEPSLGASTNQVEAHLYFGLIPLLLALGAIVAALRRSDRLSLVWAGLGTAALLYTPGWFVGLTRHLPGFNFFQDPGRYGVITTFAIGILAGKSLDRLRSTASIWLVLAILAGFVGAAWTGLTMTMDAQATFQEFGTPSPFQVFGIAVTDGWMAGVLVGGIIAIVVAFLAWRFTDRAQQPAAWGLRTLMACALLATTMDLWFVSRVVHYSEMVDNPPIRYLDASPVRKILSESGGTARVLAPVANLPTVLGAAATPVYLTFGPAAYVDPALTMPASPLSKKIEWLQHAGVTHVLSFEPLDPVGWPVRALWQGIDPLLNLAWARYREPLYLYALEGSRGRVAWEKAADGQSATVTRLRPERVAIEATSPPGGRLILTDLMYPDWSVAVDGRPAEAMTSDGMFRGVDLQAGRHTVVWSYHPRSVYWGAVASGLTLLFLAAIAHVAWWHPHRLKFLIPGTTR